MLEFYREFIKPEDTVFDIGANVGEHTAVFAELAKQVIAVEPVKESYDNIVTTLSRRNVLPLNVAVGPEAGFIDIFTSEDVPTIGIASVSPGWIKAARDSGSFGSANHWRKLEHVRVTTLDTMIRIFGEPAFIKIDVEGYEDAVLMGLSKPIPLSFEFHPWWFENCRNCTLLCDLNGLRKFNYSPMADFKFALPEWVDGDTLLAEIGKHTDPNFYGDVYARP